MKRLLFFLAYGALVHPLSAPLADLVFGTSVGGHYLRGNLQVRIEGLALFGGSTLAPLAFFGLVGALLQRAEATSRPLRWMSRAGGVAAVLTALAGQVLCWSQLDSDAQAAILFLFAPFYAAIVSVFVAVGGLVLGAVWPKPSAAPDVTAPGR